MSLSTSYLPSTPGITLPRLYRQRFKPTIKPMLMEKDRGGDATIPGRGVTNLPETSPNPRKISQKPVMTRQNPGKTTQHPGRTSQNIARSSHKPRMKTQSSGLAFELNLEKTTPMDNLVQASTPVPYLDGPFRYARYDLRVQGVPCPRRPGLG